MLADTAVTTASGGSVTNSLYVVLSIVVAACVVSGFIWRLVKATIGVASTTKDNAAVIKTMSAAMSDTQKALAENTATTRALSSDMQALRAEMGSHITLSQHEELVNRITALERQLMSKMLPPGDVPDGRQ